MPVTLHETIARESPELRAEIERGMKELIAEARRLAELRKSLGLTQVEVAQAIEMSQARLAQIEGRDDMLASTVARVVEALGGRLTLVATLPGREPVALHLRRKP